jgi:hypothetical protein
MAYSGIAPSTYRWGFKAGTGVNREDLMDAIHNIDPWDTPLFTAAPKTKAYHVYHEWPEDTLTATSSAGVHEGSDFDLQSTTTPTRKVNVTQIFRKDVQVSNTQLVVNPAGISDMYRYEVTKGLKEIKRNVEVAAFRRASTAFVTGASGTARIMKSVSDFLSTNAYQINSAGVGGAGTTTGNVSAISATRVNKLLQAVYEDGGNPMDVYCAPATKLSLSTFTGANGQRSVITAEDSTVVATMDVYVSDFGPQYIHLDRWIPTGTASTEAGGTHLYFIDRTKCKFAFLRTPKHVPIASIGDSVRGIVISELTLELMNEKGHGMLYGFREI